MKIKLEYVLLPVLGLTVLGLTLASVQAQGLLGVGKNMVAVEDFEDDEVPLTFTFGLGGGWDSNTNSAPFNENESWFGTIGGAAIYGVGNKTTHLDLGIQYAATYYDQPAPGSKHWLQDARLTLDAYHKVSPRLTLFNTTYFTYEFEPDFYIGASTSRRQDQYLYGYSRVAASYAWSRVFSTVTSFAFTGINYQNQPVGDTEDRYTYIIANQFRFLMSRQTSLTVDYRYQKTDYDTLPRDINSNIVLVGIDHYFSRQTSASGSVGAQFWNDSRSGQDTKPYFEGVIRHQVGEKTAIRWSNIVGFETNQIAGSAYNYSWRSGLTATHQLTPYLTGELGIAYVHSKYEAFPGSGLSNVDDNGITAQVGVVFQILRNMDLFLRYYYTNYSSDLPLRDYDRSRISAGMTATF